MSVHSKTWPALARDIGKKRHNNEDYVLACEPGDEVLESTKGCLYIVADGIGGGAAGEVASLFAAEAIAHHYYNRLDDPETALKRAIAEANVALYAYAHSHPRFATMGTTIVAAAIHSATLHFAHVGDSRAYLLRQKRIQRLTRDHNLAGQLALGGILTTAEAERHPQRNLLLRSIGSERQVQPDVGQAALLAGDTLLLCSDGLTGRIADSEIGDIAAESTPNQAVRALIDLANRRGGQDNISVVVVRWGCEQDIPTSREDILAGPPPLPDIDQIRRLDPTQSAAQPDPASQRETTS